MRFASLALALTLALAAGCDADRDEGTADAPPGAATPDPGAPPDEPDDGKDPLPGPLPAPEPDTGDGDGASVPARYQGRFAADAAACDTPGNPSQLTIGSDTLHFHESTGPVIRVASGPSDVAITAELTGEGETREATYRFRLSDDGGTLTDLGGGMERVRCR